MTEAADSPSALNPGTSSRPHAGGRKRWVQPRRGKVRAGRPLFGSLRFAALATTAAVALSAPLPAAAQARTAVTVERVHLRSGPGRQYPAVRVLPAGLEVQVQGCLSGFTWCDVIADADRGWVHGQRLQFDVDGRNLRAPEAGALLGLTILGFALGHYWADHYVDRPWYPQRYRWIPPPPPVIHPPPPVIPRPPARPVKPAPPPKPPPPLRWLPPAAQPPAPQPPRPPQGTPGAPAKPDRPDRGDKPERPAKPASPPPREPIMPHRAVN